MILALARPDPKKNITTLVKAFGECRPLRDLANLVCVYRQFFLCMRVICTYLHTYLYLKTCIYTSINYIDAWNRSLICSF